MYVSKCVHVQKRGSACQLMCGAAQLCSHPSRNMIVLNDNVSDRVSLHSDANRVHPRSDI